MKLIKLECPNCKSILEVNEEMKKFTCNYCGTTTLLDDEVIRVKHYNSKLDDILNEIEEYYDNGNYEKCIELTKVYINEYPSNIKLNKIRENSMVNNLRVYYLIEDYLKCYDLAQLYIDEYPESRKILSYLNNKRILNEIEEEKRKENRRRQYALLIWILFIILWAIFCIL